MALSKKIPIGIISFLSFLLFSKFWTEFLDSKTTPKNHSPKQQISLSHQVWKNKS
jgi:hypothetical protein